MSLISPNSLFTVLWYFFGQYIAFYEYYYQGFIQRGGGKGGKGGNFPWCESPPPKFSLNLIFNNHKCTLYTCKLNSGYYVVCLKFPPPPKKKIVYETMIIINNVISFVEHFSLLHVHVCMFTCCDFFYLYRLLMSLLLLEKLKIFMFT